MIYLTLIKDQFKCTGHVLLACVLPAKCCHSCCSLITIVYNAWLQLIFMLENHWYCHMFNHIKISDAYKLIWFVLRTWKRNPPQNSSWKLKNTKKCNTIHLMIVVWCSSSNLKPCTFLSFQSKSDCYCIDFIEQTQTRTQASHLMQTLWTKMHLNRANLYKRNETFKSENE